MMLEACYAYGMGNTAYSVCARKSLLEDIRRTAASVVLDRAGCCVYVDCGGGASCDCLYARGVCQLQAFRKTCVRRNRSPRAIARMVIYGRSGDGGILCGGRNGVYDYDRGDTDDPAVGQSRGGIRNAVWFTRRKLASAS